jgi:hypothetical protein
VNAPKRTTGKARPKRRQTPRPGLETPKLTREEGKRRLDPESRYSSEDLRRVEVAALDVLELLPDATIERTRDVIVLSDGGDEGIVVLVTPEAIEVRLPTVEWTGGAYGPVPSSVLWRRVDREQLGSAELAALIESARVARRAEFVPCSFCHVPTPREHRVGELVDEGGARINACHGCASTHLGIVF